MTAESLRSGAQDITQRCTGMGWSEMGHSVVPEAPQLYAVPYRNADLDKIGFRSDKDNTEIVFNICLKAPYTVNSDVTWNCRPVKKQKNMKYNPK